MKNYLQLFLITTLLTVNTAQASIVLLTGTASSFATNRHWKGRFSPAMAAGFGVIVPAMIILCISAINIAEGNVGPLQISLLVLDTDGSLPEDKLTDILSNRYPFIDDIDGLKMLAREIKERYEVSSNKSNQVEISIEEEKVRFLLAHTDVNENHLQTIITDLR